MSHAGRFYGGPEFLPPPSPAHIQYDCHHPVRAHCDGDLLVCLRCGDERKLTRAEDWSPEKLAAIFPPGTRIEGSGPLTFLCISPECLKYFDPAPNDEVISNNNGSFCSEDCKVAYDEYPE